MSLNNHSSRITLVVANPGRLMHGCKASRQFTRQGGTLGSHDCDWRLTDRSRGIQPLHCEIRWREGGFCVIDRCGETYMNGCDVSLSPGQGVRLKPDDNLQIGEYLIVAHFAETALMPNDRHLRQYSMNELLNGDDCPLRELGHPLTEREREQSNSAATPVEVLDPLAVLDNATRLAQPTALLDLFPNTYPAITPCKENP